MSTLPQPPSVGMSSSGAEKAVTISALIVAGVYAYRRLTEGSAPATGSKLRQITGEGSPPSVGVFITAWGATFLIISMISAASPSFGGSLALLVATGDLLSNTAQVSADITAKLATPQTTSSSSAATPAGAHPAAAGGHDAHRAVSGLS